MIPLRLQDSAASPPAYPLSVEVEVEVEEVRLVCRWKAERSLVVPSELRSPPAS